MKKQVEGHTSKQAPANRTLQHKNVIFKRVGCVGQTNKLSQAIKWYENGNRVQVIEQCQRFKLVRGSASIIYSGIYNNTIYEWHKKSGLKPATKQLKYIENIQASNLDGNSQVICTF